MTEPAPIVQDNGGFGGTQGGQGGMGGNDPQS